jgi:type VI secretion system secreted protein VgrG
VTQVKAMAHAQAQAAPAVSNPQAQTLQAAAESGAPFCERCEAARRAQAAQSEG